MSPPAPAGARRVGPGPPLLAWALVCGLCAAPYVRAQLRAGPGRAFVGAFYFVDDVYNYFGYVEQAARGAFLFHNKVALEPHAPSLVNLEWWGLGRVSALLGGRPLLAWWLFGIAGPLAFVLVIDAWLRRAGLPPTHRLPALLLVLLGGGFGGVLYLLRWPPRFSALDMSTGLFPFVELVANPHFVLGTTLLMASLLGLLAGGRRGTAAGLALATVAGLVRPYDLVMVVAIFSASVAVLHPLSQWPRRLLPLLALLPVVAYLGWVFYFQAAYRIFAAEAYAPPPVRWLAVALLPALALAAGSRPWPAPAPEAGRARVLLWCWIGVAFTLAVLRPVSFSLQFMVGVGVPLLALAALGLSRYRPAVTLAAAALLASSAAVVLRGLNTDQPLWLVPRERMEAARGLGRACRPGELAMAPRDIGLYALALAPCTPYASHPAIPGAPLRAAEVAAFYGSWTPAQRSAFLDARHIATVVLPPDDPALWLDRPAAFRQVVGGPEAGYAVYRRVVPVSQPAAP